MNNDILTPPNTCDHNDMGQRIGERGSDHTYSDVDLVQLFQILWRGKGLLAVVIMISAILSISIAMLLPNIYRAESLLAPVSNEEGGIKNMIAGQLGGLASIAGVNLSSGSGDANKALAILESRRFLERFIDRHNILVPLMATKWEPFARQFVIDSDIYDQDTEKWRQDPNGERELKPSAWEAVNAFRHKLSVSQDKTTRLVYISFEWHDARQAAVWVNALVADLNKTLRYNDREEAQRAISYLREQLEKTHLVDMQQVFYQLIESQMKTVMLTDAREHYAFQVIDPAVEPELKAKPRRSLICILGTFFGGIVGVAFILCWHFITAYKNLPV